LTKYSDLLEAETEETEMAVAMANMAKTAEVTETAAAVMTMAVEAAADVTDRKGSSRHY
jgi:hypothetical protein